MLESERKRLFDPKTEYINLGITPKGAVYDVTPVMWEKTSTAFNMKTPNLFIAPEDLSCGEIMERIKSLSVYGLYIYTSLEDYGFISQLPDLMDIHIRRANNIKNLDFLRDNAECSMLFISGAKLPDIDIIGEIKRSGRGILPYRYIGLYDCNIASPLNCEGIRFSEFIIWSRSENIESDVKKWRSPAVPEMKFYKICEK